MRRFQSACLLILGVTDDSRLGGVLPPQLGGQLAQSDVVLALVGLGAESDIGAAMRYAMPDPR